jgi:hypothetical protein
VGKKDVAMEILNCNLKANQIFCAILSKDPSNAMVYGVSITSEQNGYPDANAAMQNIRSPSSPLQRWYSQVQHPHSHAPHTPTSPSTPSSPTSTAPLPPSIKPKPTAYTHTVTTPNIAKFNLGSVSSRYRSTPALPSQLGTARLADV